MGEREATQQFEIRSILTSHCGQQLSPTIVDKIVEEAHQAMENGPCSWAFKAGLPTLPEEVREPTESPLQHGMNCPALILGADQDECQCGLKWRIRLRTEQEMHAAWRKRAEEAEAQLAPTDDRLSRALKHKPCGNPVSVAVLNNDVAIYLYCEHCHDLVEDGELDPPVDETKVKIRIDEERVRPFYE